MYCSADDSPYIRMASSRHGAGGAGERSSPLQECGRCLSVGTTPAACGRHPLRARRGLYLSSGERRASLQECGFQPREAFAQDRARARDVHAEEPLAPLAEYVPSAEPELPLLRDQPVELARG